MRSIKISNGMKICIENSIVPRGQSIFIETAEGPAYRSSSVAEFLIRLEAGRYLERTDYVDIISLWFGQENNTKIDAYIRNTVTGGFYRFNCDYPDQPNCLKLFDATGGRGDYIFEKDSMPYERDNLEVTEYKIYAFPTGRKVYENGTLVGYDRHGDKIKEEVEEDFD